jgi:RNA polymerase sigma factor (TIGR02999 family)
MNEDHDITRLLEDWARGDFKALELLVPLVHEELKKSAERAMARERQDHTLEPGALVSETYLRLEKMRKMSWQNRAAFFGFAAGVMRNILVEHARHIEAKKRGGRDAVKIALEKAALEQEPKDISVLGLEEGLAKLEAIDPQMTRMVVLRFYSGLSEDETAEALGVSRSTIQRDWVVAKRFLARALA